MTEIIQAIHAHFRELGYNGLDKGYIDHYSNGQGKPVPYFSVYTKLGLVRITHNEPTVLKVHIANHGGGYHHSEYYLDLNDPTSIDRLLILTNLQSGTRTSQYQPQPVSPSTSPPHT